jgi:hypothetical protein
MGSFVSESWKAAKREHSGRHGGRVSEMGSGISHRLAALQDVAIHSPSSASTMGSRHTSVVA